MKILGLISSPTDPASRARILQYREPLRGSGIELEPHYFSPLRDSDPAPWTYQVKKLTGISEWRMSNTLKTLARLSLLVRQYQYDLIWQNRLILPHHLYFEKKYNRPLVFDFDDAIWLEEGENQVDSAIRRARMVFAGNEYLAEYARKFNPEVHVIPSTIDTTKLYPLESERPVFTLGWIGSKSNFRYLDAVKKPVTEFLTRFKDSRFMVVSTDPPPQFNFDNERILFAPWKAETENQLINQFSVGIMPLAETEYTKGKCGYKLLQYMACKVPVVASPVGVNKALLDAGTGIAASEEHEWIRAFITLKNDVAFRKQCGENGLKLVDNKYNCLIWALRIAQLFRGIA